MDYSIKSGTPDKQRTACLIVGVFEPRRLSARAQQLDAACDGYISQLMRRGDLEGKLGQTLLLHHVDNTLADRILLIGCGKEREFSEKAFREVHTAAVKALENTGAMEVTNYLPELTVKGRDLPWKIQHAVLTCEQNLYRFDAFKSKAKETRRPLRKMTLMVPTRRDLSSAETAATQGQAIAEGMAFTRDLGTTPANHLRPKDLANHAKKLAKGKRLNVAILEESDMKSLGMNCFLSVTAGSTSAAKLVTMEYAGAAKSKAPIVLVGKGVTFDTGGNSLKPPAGMMGMQMDMCGAATVLGVLSAVQTLELPLNVIGVLACAENMPGPDATRPDDVVTTMEGTTVEIRNTDAEGRLLLCDTLTYVERFNPDVVIDIATLTGACLAALGHHASGVMSNHNPLANELCNAGEKSGDRAWQLPIWDCYKEQLKSPIADLSNIGGPLAGAITAGCFLSHFAKNFHWAHLDVAGTAMRTDGPRRGATGRPVPLLMQYLLGRCN